MSFVSMRLWKHHKDKDLLEEYIRLAERHRDICEETWFASDYGFPKLETHQSSAEMMAQAAYRLRKMGLKASLQISNTLGHGDYNQNLDYSGITWQRMVGHDGTVAGYSNCPRDPDFLKYIHDSVMMYSSWKPDTVWVDDDLRMNHHQPVAWGCFCDRCISEFTDLNGGSWNRDSLVNAINAVDDLSCRKKWLEFCTDSLCQVMETLIKAVVSVSPDSTIGLQHAAPDWAVYSGPEYLQKLASVVKKKTGKKMLSRPGGGFYSDIAPYGMFEKAFALDISMSVLNNIIEDFRPEIETFPHTAMNKTAHGLAVETTLYLAYGCNAISYAIMMVENETPMFFDNMLSRLDMWLPFWRRYIEMNRDTTPGGLGYFYNGRQFERNSGNDGKVFDWAAPLPAFRANMVATGLPITFRNENAAAVLLTAEVTDGMSDEELRKIFAGGVMTDGEVISRLQKRGLAYLTGVTADKMDSIDSVERLSSHEINGDHAGRVWIQYPYKLQGVYKITSTNHYTDVLGEYVRLDGSVAGIAGVATETPPGGRLAVFAYNLWEPIVNTARQYQLASAADWISRKQLPVLVMAKAPVSVVPRIDRKGNLISVFILNPSIDCLQGVRIYLRKIYGNRVVWITPFTDDLALDYESRDEEKVVTIPELAPWSTGVIGFVD